MNTQYLLETIYKALQKDVMHWVEQGVQNALKNPTSVMSEPKEEVLTVEETSLLVKKAPKTIYRLVAQRKIPHSKIGGRLLFLRSELLQWIHSCEVPTEQTIEYTSEQLLIRANQHRHS